MTDPHRKMAEVLVSSPNHIREVKEMVASPVKSIVLVKPEPEVIVKTWMCDSEDIECNNR